MSGLFDGFQERVQRVYQLLQAEETAFVLVASPEEQVLSEAEYFCRKMAELKMPLRAVVFNRAHFEFDAEPGSRASAEQELGKLVKDIAAVRRLLDNFDRHESLARGDALRMESFRRQLPRRVVTAEVPNFDSDLHDISGLRRMHPYLFGK
jgi:anion-transporting  ArsA/GET3 family ATPase